MQDTTFDVNATNDAIKTLIRCRQQVAGGSMAVWMKLDHAITHLDKQIAAYFRHV